MHRARRFFFRQIIYEFRILKTIGAYNVRWFNYAMCSHCKLYRMILITTFDNIFTSIQR